MNLTTLPDEELITQYNQHGTHSYFSELVNRHEKHVIKRCYEHLKNRDDAQDVSQEVFLRLLTKSHTYQPHLPFLPWLNTIIRNRCIDHQKQDKKELHQELSQKIAEPLEEELDTKATTLPTVELLQKMLDSGEITGGTNQYCSRSMS